VCQSGYFTVECEVRRAVAMAGAILAMAFVDLDLDLDPTSALPPTAILAEESAPLRACRAAQDERAGGARSRQAGSVFPVAACEAGFA